MSKRDQIIKNIAVSDPMKEPDEGVRSCVHCFGIEGRYNNNAPFENDEVVYAHLRPHMPWCTWLHCFQLIFPSEDWIWKENEHQKKRQGFLPRSGLWYPVPSGPEIELRLFYFPKGKHA